MFRLFPDLSREPVLKRGPAVNRPAATMRSIMSRRTATITTRVRGPTGVSTRPSDWKSRIASSIGTGMWSGASARTSSSSNFGSSTGRHVERAHHDPLVGDAEADLRGELALLEELAQLLGEAIGSATSPSRTMPGRSSATAPFVTESFPLTSTWAAARWLGSISRPTMVFSWRRRDLSMVLLSAARRAGLNARVNDEAGPGGPASVKRERGPLTTRNRWSGSRLRCRRRRRSRVTTAGAGRLGDAERRCRSWTGSP